MTVTSCGLHCLKIQHIGVRVGETVILDDVNLHAHCGELTAIIGRNGAGKSTLLKAILGEIRHTGTVEFSGHTAGERLTRDGVRYAAVVFVGLSGISAAAEKAGRSTARASEALFSGYAAG